MSPPVITRNQILKDIYRFTPDAPIRYGAVGDGVANDLAAFQAMLTAASAGDVIDLGYRAFRFATPISINKSVVIQNGSLISTSDRVALTTVAGVTLKNCTVTRTGVAGGSTACLVGNAANLTLDNCNVSSTANEALRLANGNCNGTKVIGGNYSTSSTADSSTIDLLSGAVHNYDVKITGANIRNTGFGSGITLFNCSRCLVADNDVRAIRRSPLHTFTGWENTSGNVWRALDRTDGASTNALYVDGVEVTQNSPDTSTTPIENRYSVTGGFVYLHLLGGGNPTPLVVTGTRTNGYGILMYSTVNEALGMKDNLIRHNYIEDTDGFGIYYQTLQNIPENNRTLQNTLRNVCLTGVTVGFLPFAGIGVFGGKGVQLQGDYIDGVGSELTPAPGIDFKFSPDCPEVEAFVDNVVITNGTSDGISITAGDFKIRSCRITDCVGSGITNGTLATNANCEVEIVASTCSRNAVGIQLVGTSGSNLRGTISGGRYYANTFRNVQLSRCRETYIGGGVVFNGVSGINSNLNVSDTCLRIMLGEIFIRSSLGIVLPAGLADLFVGSVIHDGSSGTKFQSASPYRTWGVKGFPCCWVIPDNLIQTTPEASITSDPGSLCIVQGQGTLFIKSTGTGNTGWALMTVVT